MNLTSFPAITSLPRRIKKLAKNLEDSCNIPDEKGQSFLEFILLLFVILSLSIVLSRGVNSGMGQRWTDLVQTITGHDLRSPPEVELP